MNSVGVTIIIFNNLVECQHSICGGIDYSPEETDIFLEVGQHVHFNKTVVY